MFPPHVQREKKKEAYGGVTDKKKKNPSPVNRPTRQKLIEAPPTGPKLVGLSLFLFWHTTLVNKIPPTVVGGSFFRAYP